MKKSSSSIISESAAGEIGESDGVVSSFSKSNNESTVPFDNNFFNKVQSLESFALEKVDNFNSHKGLKSLVAIAETNSLADVSIDLSLFAILTTLISFLFAIANLPP